MKRYDSYKDSGVEWIGEIPSHWKKTKHKFNLSILSGYPFKSELFDKSEGFPLIRIRDISSGKIETYYQGEVIEKFVVKEGDLLIGMDGDFNTRWWSSEQGLLNQRCCSIVEGSDVLRRYLHYILPIELNIINDLTYYTTVKHLSVDDINNTDTINPPLSEQQQIVSFLDTKTTLIDSLIEKTQRKIELLKEKRTSLINEIVTKGLNPNVEMKDSGVEWIGEIPNHWRSPFFGLISNLQQGLQIPFDERFFEKEEGMYEYITTKSVHRPNDPRQYVLNPKKTVVCNENEILYGRTGNTGEVITNVEGVFHNNFFKIEYDKNTLTKEYLIYQLTNSRFKETILILSGTTTIPDLNHGDFNSMRCLTPPISEQQQIVSYLDEQTQLIDKTISIEEKRIELLKEYRQSLISGVVTGKRKVD